MTHSLRKQSGQLSGEHTAIVLVQCQNDILKRGGALNTVFKAYVEQSSTLSTMAQLSATIRQRGASCLAHSAMF